jgi:glycosyltransferase involved in cell wall biosynthesis
VKITLYIICYNEQLILPHLLNYYSTIVDKIVVYDNESTDNTLKILNEYKGNLEIRTFKTNHQLRDDIHSKIKNTCWIGDDSDYCIINDADEFIYHPFGLRNYLEQNLDNDFLTPVGYQMVSDNFPNDYSKLIIEQVKKGTPDEFYNKLSIINPKRVVDINFKPGGHEVHYEVIGPNIKTILDSNLKLLHYKFLGLEYVLNRRKQYPVRMSNMNVEKGWGRHYTEPEEETIDYYNTIKEESKIII